MVRCGDAWSGRGVRRGNARWRVAWRGRGMRRGDMWSGRNMRSRGRAWCSRRVWRGSCRAAVPASWLLRLRRARRRHGGADNEQSRDANIALKHGTTSRVVRRQLTSDPACWFRTTPHTRDRSSMTNCSESPHLAEN